MVSESGVYQGDLRQRRCETMPFGTFLRAAHTADGCAPQHLYLAQASSLATRPYNTVCTLLMQCAMFWKHGHLDATCAVSKSVSGRLYPGEGRSPSLYMSLSMNLLASIGHQLLSMLTHGCC